MNTLHCNVFRLKFYVGSNINSNPEDRTFFMAKQLREILWSECRFQSKKVLSAKNQIEPYSSAEKRIK